MTQRGPEAFLTPRTELLAGDPDGTLVGRVRAVVAGASTRGRVVLAESASVRAIDVWAGPGGIVTHGYRRDEASATAGGLHDPELGAVVLHDLLAAAVDDDANKRAQFAPGFKVPVTTSADLARDLRIRTCLLAVNPGVEHKIKAKLAPMVERGVQFHSIFAGVPGSILSELPPWRYFKNLLRFS